MIITQQLFEITVLSGSNGAAGYRDRQPVNVAQKDTQAFEIGSLPAKLHTPPGPSNPFSRAQSSR
jgi:hypothetical protein